MVNYYRLSIEGPQDFNGAARPAIAELTCGDKKFHGVDL